MKAPPATAVNGAYLDELRRRVRLSDLIRHRVALKRAGREFIGRCPFHAEKTASFTVNDTKRFYHCFGCGAHGDALRFVRETDGLDFLDAVHWLADWVGMDRPDGGRAKRRLAMPPPPQAAPPPEPDDPAADEQRRQRLVALWRRAKPIGEAPWVRAWLQARGVWRDTICPGSIRGVDDLPYFVMVDDDTAKDGQRPLEVGRAPAMVAALVDLQRLITGLHITWLSPDGTAKAEFIHPETGEVEPARKIRGRGWGSAIRLTPSGPSLVIAEGIETAWAIRMARPVRVWAAGTLGNIAGAGKGRGAPHPDKPGQFLPSEQPDPARPGLRLPAHVIEVVIAEDADNGDPLAAACRYACAERRWAILEGRRVRRIRPPPGTDFNDLIMGEAA